MQKFMGINSAESIGMSANIFLGKTEAPLLIRPYVARLTKGELLCLTIGSTAPEQRGDLALLGLRSLFGGTLATMATSWLGETQRHFGRYMALYTFREAESI